MADSKGPPPQTPVTPSTNKSTKASPITPFSNKAASHQRADHYASGTHTEPIKVPTVNTHLMQDCNTARLLPFEEFAIKILRLPEDWKDRWSAQLAGALELHEWTKYEDTWKKERHENRLYLPFTQLCNKAIATMTGGQNRTSSLVVYGHDKGYQIGYTKRAPDIASTLWGWAEKVGGKLDERKVFVGFDNKGFKRISWEQVRMFEEIKNTPNGSTFGGAEFLSPNFVKRSKVESSQTSSNVTSSGSKKRGLDSVTASQTSAQGTQKRQRNSQSIRTSVGSQTVSSSRNRMSGDPPTDNNNPDHVRLQCAGYALEMLTSGRVRSHAFGMLVDGPNVQLQYYDRSIILRTRGISLFDQDERRLFLAALYRFTQFAPVDWGILLNADEEDLGMSTKHEIEKKSRVDPLAGMEFTLEKDGTRKRIRLVCLIFRSHGVIGRGTIVAEAVCICGGSGCGCDWGGSLVVKISFPATSRVMEYELVSEALNKAVGEHVWVKNHLPRILWAQNISFGEDTPQEQLAKLFPDKYEERHVCITVQRKLQPIHDLVTPEEFAQVFYDILQCHRWLYVIPKILHRDISMNNIMFWRNPTTREVYGVLNDFDLSSRVAEDRTASSKQRTGTKPYMAHDLFNNEWVLGHLYRHDLESIFYVLLCLCSRYKGPGEHVDVLKDQRPPYERWFTEGYEVVRAMKIALFSDDSSKITDVITDFFRNFKVWAVGIHDCISRGFAYRQWARTDKNPFDHHTLGGQFTYATVSAIMSHFDGFQLKTRSTVSLD